MSRKIRGHSNRDPFEEQRAARELQEEEEARSRGVAYNPNRSYSEEDEELSQRRRKEDGGYYVHVNGWD
jgi:hypothetical protein